MCRTTAHVRGISCNTAAGRYTACQYIDAAVRHKGFVVRSIGGAVAACYLACATARDGDRVFRSCADIGIAAVEVLRYRARRKRGFVARYRTGTYCVAAKSLLCGAAGNVQCVPRCRTAVCPAAIGTGHRAAGDGCSIGSCRTRLGFPSAYRAHGTTADAGLVARGSRLPDARRGGGYFFTPGNGQAISCSGAAGTIAGNGCANHRRRPGYFQGIAAGRAAA